MRLLPSFLIIGAMKAGTTSLFRYLCRHPQVAAPTRKEIHFFDLHYSLGLSWYRSHFPIARPWTFRGPASSQLIISGEASPYYLFHPSVPERVRDCLPNVKLILLLRDPVERAVSHYYHEVRMGREVLSFSSAVAVEWLRLEGEEERLGLDATYRAWRHQHFSYVARGFYADQLKRWKQHFGRRQMLILPSEWLNARPEEVANRVLAFLGLPAAPAIRFPHLNRGVYDENIPQRTLAALRELFQPHNERLYAMTGIDFRYGS